RGTRDGPGVREEDSRKARRKDMGGIREGEGEHLLLHRKQASRRGRIERGHDDSGETDRHPDGGGRRGTRHLGRGGPEGGGGGQRHLPRLGRPGGFGLPLPQGRLRRKGCAEAGPYPLGHPVAEDGRVRGVEEDQKRRAVKKYTGDHADHDLGPEGGGQVLRPRGQFLHRKARRFRHLYGQDKEARVVHPDNILPERPCSGLNEAGGQPQLPISLL
ncbi:MAG: hypothetical protein DRQ14_05490, partial [Candidatus Latescibacterota bacterium]